MVIKCSTCTSHTHTHTLVHLETRVWVLVCVFKAVDILTAMDTDTLFMATGDINEHQPRQPTYSRP